MEESRRPSEDSQRYKYLIYDNGDTAEQRVKHDIFINCIGTISLQGKENESGKSTLPHTTRKPIPSGLECENQQNKFYRS